MKNIFILLLSSLCVVTICNAQHLPSRNDDLENLRHPTPGNLRGITVYLPLSETDSAYDISTNSWYYVTDAAHQYYSSNCKDSVITYSYNGVVKSRGIFQWDAGTGFNINTLYQSYTNNLWHDSLEYQQPLQPPGCFYKYVIYRSWNGSGWDTTIGRREDIVYDANNNPTVRTYTKYSAGVWKNYHQFIDSYDAQNRLAGEELLPWDIYTNQYLPSTRDTLYQYNVYNARCNYDLTFFESDSYISGNWTKNGVDSVFYPDNYGSTIFKFYSWDGFVLTPFAGYINNYDAYGNNTAFYELIWNYSTLTWDTSYIDIIHAFTYGGNGEILRDEYSSYNCSNYGYDLVPCTVVLYSNFITCDLSTAVVPAVVTSSLTVYPNPAADAVQINLPLTDAGAFVTFYNSLGQEVKRVGLPSKSNNIAITPLEKGFYFLIINSGSKKLYSELVVQ